MPEGASSWAQAVVHLATAPKSNAAYNAINAAVADVRAGRGRGVPMHLRDAHYAGAKQLGHGKGYIYSHDAPHSSPRQQYPPDDLLGVDYYQPTANGAERDISARLERMRGIIRGQGPPARADPRGIDGCTAQPAAPDSKCTSGLTAVVGLILGWQAACSRNQPELRFREVRTDGSCSD